MKGKYIWTFNKPSDKLSYHGLRIIPFLGEVPMSDVGERLRVLVVDDEKSIADSLALILQTKDFNCCKAYSAEDAIEIAEVFRPHAVISDIFMGKMTGIDLAIYLAQHQPECKVLLISGNSNAMELMEEAGNRGHHRPILSKPVHPKTLLNFLENCLAPRNQEAV